jgi:tellurite resistance protein TehA-like permease
MWKSRNNVFSIGIILLNICEYGIPRSGVWLLRTMEVLFWIYVALSVAASAGLYLILWSTLYVYLRPIPSSTDTFHIRLLIKTSVFPVHMMTPTWVFPAYPLLLTAPLASNLIDSAQRSGHELTIDRAVLAFGAATTQGTGCLIAFMISAAFMYRLMTQKLPRDMQRPGVVSNLNSTATFFPLACRAIADEWSSSSQ